MGKRKALLLPLLLMAGLLSLCFVSCRIEPPLNLADMSHVEFLFPEVETDIHVIWGDEIEGDWWYGWDEDDERLFGKIEYPEPRDYEVRHYYLGRSRGDWLQFNSFTIDGNHFHRNLHFGYHDLLFWSNVVTDLGVQALLVDESDPNDIRMTTSPTRISYLPSRGQNVYNSPEPFFSALYRGLYVSKDPADYDYSYTDEKGRQIYVKKLDVDVTPMVYTYLVQAVIYNNKGRIRGLTDMATVTSMAKGVSVHTGMTSDEDAVIAWDMRMKKNMPARDGKIADIMGGKLTTFGLCGMQPWRSSRSSAAYRGPRGDLRNKLALSMSFTDYKDSVYYFDVTDQMQSQAHGGIITIEIDADTLTFPVRPPAGGNASGFDPTIAGRDSVEYDFGL